MVGCGTNLSPLHEGFLAVEWLHLGKGDIFVVFAALAFVFLLSREMILSSSTACFCVAVLVLHVFGILEPVVRVWGYYSQKKSIEEN